jgi:glycerol-3-phosphate dehydrogenase (NAD(P)+)
MNRRLTILGGGSWGTALAVILSPQFDRLNLWVRRREQAEAMESSRENRAYLPGITLPPNVFMHTDAWQAVEGAGLLLCVLPSQAVRSFFEQTKVDPEVPIVSATKGLETGSLLRMSQVITQASGSQNVAILSGPSFAAEAAAGRPTAVVVASENPVLATAVQSQFSCAAFRVYTSDDPIGVELGGAYKNVVAIGAGVCHGLGLGSNAISALITRGLAEMTRLAVKMGGKQPTLAGLAGLGDLVLTCTGSLSRNRLVGEQLAHGSTIADIVSNMRMVAEGVGTTHSIVKLGEIHDVELPIAAQMDALLNFGRKPDLAIKLLMERSLKNES